MRKRKLKFVFQQSILRAFTCHRSLHTLIKAENIFEMSYQNVILFFFSKFAQHERGKLLPGLLQH